MANGIVCAVGACVVAAVLAGIGSSAVDDAEATSARALAGIVVATILPALAVAVVNLRGLRVAGGVGLGALRRTGLVVAGVAGVLVLAVVGCVAASGGDPDVLGLSALALVMPVFALVLATATASAFGRVDRAR